MVGPGLSWAGRVESPQRWSVCGIHAIRSAVLMKPPGAVFAKGEWCGWFLTSAFSKMLSARRFGVQSEA